MFGGTIGVLELFENEPPDRGTKIFIVWK